MSFYITHLESIPGLEINIVNRNEIAFFDYPAPISSATNHSITWLKPGNEHKQQLIANTNSHFIICASDEVEELVSVRKDINFIATKQPKLTFIRILTALFAEHLEWGVHPTATIHPEARVHAKSWIGPKVCIGKVTVDEGTRLIGNIFIYDNVRIGKNVTIHAGAVVGGDGFGYERDGDLVYKFPHLGGVVIEDDVEIGANTCIDRGTLGDTVLRAGCKIDNLVHIAHNCEIGAGAFVIAHTTVGGSVTIGQNSWIAPGCTIKQGLKVGNNATLGMGAVVTKNVPNTETWAGAPAKELSKFLATQAAISNMEASSNSIKNK